MISARRFPVLFPHDAARADRLYALGCPAAVPWRLVAQRSERVIRNHDQLVEHGNLIIQGDYNQRNVGSRNLRNDTICQKLFHFLTHGDTREHVLHHTLVAVNSRPFPGRIPMPSNAVYISLRDYAGILWEMIRRG